MNEDVLMLPAGLRLLRAIAIVLAIVVAAPGVEAMFKVMGARQAAQSAEAGLHAAALADSGDAFAALDRIEAVASPSAPDLPEAFSSEVGILPGAQDVRAYEGGAIVGYTVSDAADQALARLVSHMEARGWTSVPLGDTCGATFVKQGGSCTWVLATCTQMDKVTSVVERCVIA